MVFKKRLGSNYRKVANDLAGLGSFGFLMAAAIFIGYYLGSFLDEYFGASPFFLIIFVLLGIVGAFLEFLKTLKKKQD